MHFYLMQSWTRNFPLRAFAPLRLCEKQKTCIKVRPEIFSQSRKGAKARKEEEAVAVDNGLESTKSQLQIFYKSIINIQYSDS